MQNTKQIDDLLKKYGQIKLSDITPDQIKRGQEIISKLDLSQIVFDGQSTKFNEITSPVELVRYLSSKQRNNDVPESYISHYTNFEVAKKIIAGKKMQLGNPANMNDGLEFNSPTMDCSKLYFASFSIEKSSIDKKSSKCGRNKTGVRQNRDARIWYFSFEPCHAPRYAVLMVPISPEIQES